MEYRPETWVSFYDVTITICAWYAYYVDFLKNLVVVFTDAIIDIITLLKIQKMRKQYRNGKRSENYTKKETDFLKQVKQSIIAPTLSFKITDSRSGSLLFDVLYFLLDGS